MSWCWQDRSSSSPSDQTIRGFLLRGSLYQTMLPVKTSYNTFNTWRFVWTSNTSHSEKSSMNFVLMLFTYTYVYVCVRWRVQTMQQKLFTDMLPISFHPKVLFQETQTVRVDKLFTFFCYFFNFTQVDYFGYPTLNNSLLLFWGCPILEFGFGVYNCRLFSKFKGSRKF